MIHKIHVNMGSKMLQVTDVQITTVKIIKSRMKKKLTVFGVFARETRT